MEVIAVGVGILVILLAVLLYNTLYTVQQQKVAVIQRFGRYVKTASAGLGTKIPFIDSIVGNVNLRVQQLDVKVETKTEDNVFVFVIVSVQYFVRPDKVYEAFYKLQNPNQQITSFVFDVVRAHVPKIKLDDVFEKKDEIAGAVKAQLETTMDDFGYGIVKTLVTDIEPDSRVKEAMNEINAAQRLRVAANEKGEAEKILRIKQAEGEAESKRLQGEGIANQRKAIIHGLQNSVSAFQSSVQGTTAHDVMQLVLMTQYFDTMRDIAGHSGATTILMPHSPGGMADISAQIRDAIVTAGQVNASVSKQEEGSDS